MANLKAWYDLAEIAELSQTEGWRLRRYLQKEHPEILHKRGRTYFVYLHDLQTSLESLWQSILTMEALKAGLRGDT